MRLLLVEDDIMIGEALCQGLRMAGFEPLWLRDGAAVEQALETRDFDAILLDLGLPNKAGLEVLESIRCNGNRLPVIILTARDKVCDRIKGLNMGADDYILKPFDLDELAARVRAVLRRQSDDGTPCLQVGGLSLNSATHEATWEGRRLMLSRSEFLLLETFASRPGLVFSRAQLEQDLYGVGQSIESNTVEVHIHNLRKKLGPEFIKNIRGVGYMLSRRACSPGAVPAARVSASHRPVHVAA